MSPASSLTWQDLKAAHDHFASVAVRLMNYRPPDACASRWRFPASATVAFVEPARATRLIWSPQALGLRPVRVAPTLP